MPKRKGLSLEEKRAKVLKIYHKRLEVFNLKEIEKLASKEGVVSQSVKDVNKSLVDDGLVDQDKIGSGVFFWSFPSKRFQALQAQIAKHDAERERSETQLASIAADTESALEGRKPTAERERKLEELAALEARLKENQEREAELKENDPAELERLEALSSTCRDAANRWTDNVWAIKKWLVKKKNPDPKRVDQMLGITASFDYLP